MNNKNFTNPTLDTHRAILICTSKRGVFFGYIPKDGPSNEEIHSGKLFTLHRPRMAVYWSSDVGGVLGLATEGPSEGCRIGPAPASITLASDTPHDCVADVTADAVAKWELAPWRK